MGWLWNIFGRTPARDVKDVKPLPVPEFEGLDCWGWAERVKSGSWPMDRLSEAFRAMGDRAAPALIEVFGGNSVSARAPNIAEMLASMGQTVIPQLVNGYLSHPNQQARAGCGAALRRIGPPAAQHLCRTLCGDVPPEKAAAFLVDALGRDESPRDTLVWVLTQVGRPAVPILLQALASPLVHVRRAVLEVLAKTAIAEDSTALVDVLNDADPQVARSATHLLGKFCTSNSIAAQALTALLRDGKELAQEAIGPLARLGAPAVDALSAGLRHPNAKVVKAATTALSRLGEAASVPLTMALKDPDEEVRAAAAEALATASSDTTRLASPTLGGEAPPSVVALVAALEDPAHAVRKAVIKSLGQFLRCAPLAVLGLVRTATDSNDSASASASLALESLYTKEAEVADPALMAALAAALADPKPAIRRKVVNILARIKTSGTAHVTGLFEVVRDDDIEVRKAARYAITKISPEGVLFLPEVTAKHPDALLRIQALLMLAPMAADNDSALMAIQVAASDPDESVREVAGVALRATAEVQKAVREHSCALQDLETQIEELERTRRIAEAAKDWDKGRSLHDRADVCWRDRYAHSRAHDEARRKQQQIMQDGLIVLVRHAHEHVRRSAVAGLASSEATDARVVAVLVSALEDPSEVVRGEVLDQLACLADERDVLDALTAAVSKQPEGRLRIKAIEILERQAPYDPATHTAINAALTDHDEHVRDVAARVFHGVETKLSAQTAAYQEIRKIREKQDSQEKLAREERNHGYACARIRRLEYEAESQYRELNMEGYKSAMRQIKELVTPLLAQLKEHASEEKRRQKFEKAAELRLAGATLKKAMRQAIRFADPGLEDLTRGQGVSVHDAASQAITVIETVNREQSRQQE